MRSSQDPSSTSCIGTINSISSSFCWTLINRSNPLKKKCCFFPRAYSKVAGRQIQLRQRGKKLPRGSRDLQVSARELHNIIVARCSTTKPNTNKPKTPQNAIRQRSSTIEPWPDVSAGTLTNRNLAQFNLGQGAEKSGQSPKIRCQTRHSARPQFTPTCHGHQLTKVQKAQEECRSQHKSAITRVKTKLQSSANAKQCQHSHMHKMRIKPAGTHIAHTKQRAALARGRNKPPLASAAPASRHN